MRKSGNINKFIRPQWMDFTSQGIQIQTHLKKNGSHNEPQDLVTMFLCIQIAIDKIQLCSLSVAYAWSYHNPTATLFTTLTSANRSPTWNHTHGLWLWSWLEVLANSLKRHWRRLMVEKSALNYLSTALVDIPAVSMPISHSLKTWDICGIVLCDRTAHLEWPFIVPSTRCTCVMMLFNQLLDMSHLSGR